MSKTATIRVCIVYPTDLSAVINGGVETLLRTLIAGAPDDIQFSHIGVTCDSIRSPLRRWSKIDIQGQELNVFPVARLANPNRKPLIPISLKFTLALLARRYSVDADILEFHRLEPIMPFRNSRALKRLVMHQDMRVIMDSNSDIRWRRLPQLYFMLEDVLLKSIDELRVVRAPAAEWYRSRYPFLADRIRFMPTWYDSTKFRPQSDEKRSFLRAELSRKLGFPPTSKILVAVGRIDEQKNPLLMARMHAQVTRLHEDARLIWIGDGALRAEFEKTISELGLMKRVFLPGTMRNNEIADVLGAADLYIMTSSYEGMPVSLLEAVGTGLPAVSTNVGEIDRVIREGINGSIVAEHDPKMLAAAAIHLLEQPLDDDRRRQIATTVSEFTANRSIARIYEQYRSLAIIIK